MLVGKGWSEIKKQTQAKSDIKIIVEGASQKKFFKLDSVIALCLNLKHILLIERQHYSLKAVK